jgi:glycosyltransferase involved in cell wall biosynthesis
MNEARPLEEQPKILVLGQTPPPYHGQALMIQQLVEATFTRIRTYHVRMSFSDSMSSVGRASTGKVVHLAGVVRRALQMRLRHQIPVLYYPPAGPTPAAVMRDMMILGALRPFFSRVIFHFHAAGLSDFLETKSPALRRLARAMYGRPDAAIQISALASPDAQFFGTRRLAIIPNGIEDAALPYLDRDRAAEERVRVLFVGAISEAKGTRLLLEAVRELAARRSDFTLWMMGQFSSEAYEREVRGFCRDHQLDHVVSFLGLQVDDDKWRYFHRADILCHPSYLESFGNVLVEAMMFRLPVVATRAGGMPDIVESGVTGSLLADFSPGGLAAALEQLIAEPEMRQRMGKQGRRRYLERFTLDTHLQRMENFLYDVARS